MKEKNNCNRETPCAWDWIELKSFCMQVMWYKILISLNVLVFFHFPTSLVLSFLEVKCKGNQNQGLHQNKLILFTLSFIVKGLRIFSCKDTIMGGSWFFMLLKPPNHKHTHTDTQGHRHTWSSSTSKHTSLCMCVIQFLTVDWNVLKHLKMK